MNSTIYLILIALMVIMTINNFRKIKQNGNDKDYVESYRKIITRSEDALEFTDEYIARETNTNLIIKASVMKLGELLERSLDVQETMSVIDFKSLFGGEKGVNQLNYDSNSDVFLWVMAVMAKAKKMNREDLIEALYAKVNEVNGLEPYMEYQLVKSYHDVLTGNKDLTFVNKLLNGEYGDYIYAKKTVGLNKRFAEALKAYAKEELDELSRFDIPAFAETALGDYLMKDLGIYDEYAVKKEEEKSEGYLDTIDTDKEEENKEE